jgi:hypothetical protein
MYAASVRADTYGQKEHIMSAGMPPSSVYPPSSPQPEPSAELAATSSTPSSAGGANVGRRALLVTLAVVAAAAATPFALEKGAELATDEIRALLQRELNTVEGIALDDAIAIAELTRKAVEFIVVPLATFLTTVSGDGLLALIDTIGAAEAVLNAAHLPTDGLPSLATLLSAWRQNESQLPISLQAYATADITGAEQYLRAVKAKTDGSAAV